jgi:hypothetical protein
MFSLLDFNYLFVLYDDFFFKKKNHSADDLLGFSHFEFQ